MVTGDHIETARHVALTSGLCTEEELNSQDTVLTGQEFRQKLVRTYEKNEATGEFTFDQSEESKKIYKKIKKKVKVIARCNPEDKLLLIKVLQDMNGQIAMCGDSISDAAALIAADVGMCMGTGCDVAKDNSDLVITDNNFSSILSTMMWGRQLYDNVRKFLAFQMTINVVIISITAISGMTIGRVPFNVIQMLWINLIMDILGAIALGTDPYRKRTDISEANKFQRIRRADKIFTPYLWRQIFVHSVW